MWNILGKKEHDDPVSCQTGQPINIGSRLELFTDGCLIDKMNGVELRLHHPVRREVALYFDAPWEGPWSGYVTVFEDADGYRMYYRGCNYGRDKREHTCVALSEDGIHWTRPKLGLFDFEGDRETNIVWVGQGAHAFSPFIDTNPDCKPEERYKAVAPDTGSAMGAALYAFSSPDGFKSPRATSIPTTSRSGTRFAASMFATSGCSGEEYPTASGIYAAPPRRTSSNGASPSG